jgi:crotonobetainyl-CoA:carnitine CoA-transferase CaiB-like acyl-CoA transferase
MMNSYRTKDGRWFFFTGLEADRHIDKIYLALGREDLHDDPRFANARALRQNRTEVIAVLDDIIGQEPLSVRAERFEREGVWWAPAQTPAEVLEDPQLLANDGIVELRSEADGASQRSINGPVSFSDAPIRPHTPAPRLGEHTDAVLAELAQRGDPQSRA